MFNCRAEFQMTFALLYLLYWNKKSLKLYISNKTESFGKSRSLPENVNSTFTPCLSCGWKFEFIQLRRTKLRNGIHSKYLVGLKITCAKNLIAKEKLNYCTFYLIIKYKALQIFTSVLSTQVIVSFLWMRPRLVHIDTPSTHSYRAFTVSFVFWR